ncbi:MAG TPA: hypothetical protein PKV86_12295 [Syntrophobacteraceae bacterium]|nr:hypothetical protein [Syntrophobacteraceae bacterium]
MTDGTEYPPAEIVNSPDFVQFASCREHPAHSLVDGCCNHVIGVDHRKGRVERLCDGKPALTLKNWPQDHRIVRDVSIPTCHEFDHAGSLHLVIVLPLDPFS